MILALADQIDDLYLTEDYIKYLPCFYYISELWHSYLTLTFRCIKNSVQHVGVLFRKLSHMTSKYVSYQIEFNIAIIQRIKELVRSASVTTGEIPCKLLSLDQIQ